MASHKPERLTLPDRHQQYQPKDTAELNTTPLPAVPPRLAQLQFRPITLVPYLGTVEVISQDLAELIRHREKVANLETMRLQALVVKQDRTHIPTMQPVDTPPSQVAQGAVQSLSRRRVNRINPKNVYKHIMTDPLI